MLPTAQLEKNKKRFIETNAKYNIFTPELEEFLGDDFYIAPVSSTTNMVGCYPGGLLHFLIRACTYAIKVNKTLPDSLKQDEATIIKVVFLSKIGKVFTLRLKDNAGGNQPYEFDDDMVRLHVGERSVYYALTHGVKLTELETQAILALDKGNSDKMLKYFSEPLTEVIKIGFDLAVMEEKNGKPEET